MATGNSADRKPFNLGGLNGDLNIRLGADPEFVPIGERGLVKFRGAASHIIRGTGDQKGQDYEFTEWWQCEMWCNTDDNGQPIGPAKSIMDRYRSGMLITVFGKREPRPFTDKQGNERVGNGFVVSRINFGNEVSLSDDEGVEEEAVVSKRPATRAPATAPAGRSSGRKSAPSSDYEWEG